MNWIEKNKTKQQNKPFSGAQVFLDLTIGPFFANFYGAIPLWWACCEFASFYRSEHGCLLL